MTLFIGCNSKTVESSIEIQETAPVQTETETEEITEKPAEPEPETEPETEPQTEKPTASERVPSQWEQTHDTGSIMEIADIEWAEQNAPDFYVTTPEELAGVVYYVNAVAGGSKVYISIGNDIDLKDLKWVPMGWVDSPFSGTVDGQNHKIKNMHMDCQLEPRTGFIGYGLEVQADNIVFENAEVHGGTMTGTVAGELYMSSSWRNIGASGSISCSGTDCGGIIGKSNGTVLYNCWIDVKMNGMPYPFMTYSDKLYAENNPSEIFEILMDDSFIVTRNSYEGFFNKRWHVWYNDTDIALDSAENETGHNYNALIAGKAGHYKIWLDSFYNNTYMRVSNIIEFWIDKDGVMHLGAEEPTQPPESSDEDMEEFAEESIE